MPTGYTKEIYEGKEISAKDFIMRCARAFGACIEMRDESLNKKIPEQFETNDFYLQQIEATKRELEYYENMSIEQAQEFCDQEYEKEVQADKEYKNEKEQLEKRYKKILDEVTLWKPPSLDHDNLKQFCINQLKISIKFDCCYYPKEIEKKDPHIWLRDKITRCYKDLQYYSGKYKKEIEKVNNNNLWVKQLIESFS